MDSHISGVDTTSNFRPFAIFGTYMLIALSLALLIVSSLSQTRKAQLNGASRVRVIIFSLFAAASLFMTWKHMFSFFAYSYNAWASRNRQRQLMSFSEFAIVLKQAYAEEAHGANFANWLRDTQLFRLAWGSACETPVRFWWTQQIFWHATGWSVFLSQQGNRYNITHLWAYMLLGQIVAISFAMNLFYVAVSVQRTIPRQPARKPGIQDLRSKARMEDTQDDYMVFFGNWHARIVLAMVIVTTLTIEKIPASVDKPVFMPLLLFPHMALLLLPLLPKILPTQWLLQSHEQIDQLYTSVYWLIGGLVGLKLVQSSLPLLRDGVGLFDIAQTLYEHPAVTSVGWDVVSCWISVGIWTALRDA